MRLWLALGAAVALLIPGTSAQAKAPTVSVLPLRGDLAFVGGVLDGGVVYGNDVRATGFTETPWLYAAGRRTDLPTSGATGHVDAATVAGYAAGTVDGRAVRWQLGRRGFTSLSPEPSRIGGMNLAGDAVVVNASGPVEIVPARGARYTVGASAAAAGLSLRKQTVLYDPAAGSGPWSVVSYMRSENLPQRFYDCPVPINDAGWLALSGEGAPARLRDPAGRLTETGLAVVRCARESLSLLGHLVGFTAEGQAALQYRGRLTPLTVPGGTAVVPYAVNERGQVLLGYHDAEDRPRMAIWRAGALTPLPLPTAGPDTFVLDVKGVDLNDTGQAVAQYETIEGGNYHSRVLLWKF